MSLLEEIQNAAVDGKTDLATLLRKFKLFAGRVGSRPLEEWVHWESDGYPDDAPVPEYRKWPLQVKGHFSGPFGSSFTDAPIPYACIPERARDAYAKFVCRTSIASIDETLRHQKAGSAIQVSTGDLAVALGGNVYKGMNCVQAWAEFSSLQFVELANAVRNRVLDLSIALWREFPSAGEAGTSARPTSEVSRVTQIFNTVVHGGSANLVGTAISSTVNVGITAGDFESLARTLRENGLPEDRLSDLRSALQAEPTQSENGKFGPRVSAWISTTMQLAATGAWNIGLGAAGSLLANAISRFYGLPG